jgi:hypothetical protein
VLYQNRSRLTNVTGCVKCTNVFQIFHFGFLALLCVQNNGGAILINSVVSPATKRPNDGKLKPPVICTRNLIAFQVQCIHAHAYPQRTSASARLQQRQATLLWLLSASRELLREQNRMKAATLPINTERMESAERRAQTKLISKQGNLSD